VITLAGLECILSKMTVTLNLKVFILDLALFDKEREKNKEPRR